MQCGGKGKEGNIPPPEYVPDCFVNKKIDMEIEKVSLQNEKMPKYDENNIPETLLKVSQKGNIIETRREIITPNKDGTFKRLNNMPIFPNANMRGLTEILEHISGGNVDLKTSVIDAQILPRV